MNFLGLCIQNWRITVGAILMSLLTLMTILYQSAEKEIEGLKSQSRLEIVARESAVREAKSKSDSTLKEINREHAKLVAAAEKNAFANFKRKYHDANRSSLGSGIRGDNSIGMRLPTSPDSVPADSAKSPNGATEGIMAFDGGLLAPFTRDCAIDAATLVSWQRWATENRLQIEK